MTNLWVPLIHDLVHIDFAWIAFLIYSSDCFTVFHEPSSTIPILASVFVF